MSKRHIGIAVTLSISFLAAHPSGHNVAHGQADVQALQNLLQITTSDKAILNWQEFSSKAGETVRFVQPSSSSAVLNRVTGGNASTLYGNLEANGQVYLVNPNGIVIGQHARIDAGAFTASTFDVLDSDFLEGNALRFFGGSKAGVVNLGTIKTSAGDCSLISFQVENDGMIESTGQAALVASNKVILKPHDLQRIYIASDQDASYTDNPYLLAFNQIIEKDALHFKKDDTGVFLTVDAPVATAAGQIAAESAMVLGDYVQVLDGASIDVSSPNGGGTILIGGDFQGKNDTLVNAKSSYIASEAELRADAVQKGDGGRVVVWSDEATFFHGNISARGGSLAGEGGVAEVSGGYLEYRGLADLRAAYGRAGTLYMDPADVNINAGPTTGGVNLASIPATLPAGSPISIANSGAGGLGAPGGQLTLSSVTINTNVGSGGSGDITVVAGFPVTWATANTLTLIADRDIIVNSDITATGAGGNIFLQAGRNIDVSANVINNETATATGGDVTLIADTGNINIPPAAGGIATALNVGNNFGTVLVRATLGDVNLRSGTANDAYACIGTAGPAPGPTTTQNDIIVEAGGDITLLAQSLPIQRASVKIGRSPFSLTALQSVNGDTTVTAQGNISLTANTSMGAVLYCNAQIGEGDHGNLVGYTGDITVNAGGNLTVTSGSHDTARGVIGYDGNNGIGAGHVLHSNLKINVGGNFLMQGMTIPTSFLLIGYSNGTGGGQNVATSMQILVAGNIWMDGRLSKILIHPGYRIGAPLAGYNPTAFVHCLGDVYFIGTLPGASGEAGFDYERIGNAQNFLMTHLWAGGSIRCLNGPGRISSAIAFNSNYPNVSVRAAGDFIQGDFTNHQTISVSNFTGEPYAPFNVNFRGFFIEADSCFAQGELWPAQSATVNGSNIFALAPLGSPSPAIACDGLGGFAIDSAQYTALGLLPTPYNGAQVNITAGAIPSAVGQRYGSNSSTGNLVFHSADTFLGELFRPAYAAGNPVNLTIAPAAGNPNALEIPVIISSSNIEVSGSQGPSFGNNPPAGCGCVNSFNNIDILAGGIGTTSRYIYISANNNLNNTSATGSPITVTGPAATSFITLIADNDDTGSGNLTLGQNVTSAGGSITLDAGFGAGGGSSIDQNAGQISSSGGAITARAAGNITFNGAAVSVTSGAGNISATSTAGSITSNQDVTSTTGNIAMNAGVNINVLATGSVTSTSGGNIDMTAGNDVNVSGDAASISSTTGHIFTTAGHDTNVTTNIATAGEILMISGRSMFLTAPTTSIVSSAGPVTLVTDNDFPTAPGIGPGFFSSVAGSVVASGPGQSLQVFTALQGQNSILGTCNGATLTAGTIFIDSATEQWCTYYPSPFFGGVFTVFYKDCQAIIVQAGNKVVSDMLFNLEPENMWIEEFLSPLIPPEVWRFMIIYDKGVNAFTRFEHERYWLSRRNIHFVHYPYVYKENKPLAELVPKEAGAKVAQHKKGRV